MKKVEEHGSIPVALTGLFLAIAGLAIERHSVIQNGITDTLLPLAFIGIMNAGRGLIRRRNLALGALFVVAGAVFEAQQIYEVGLISSIEPVVGAFILNFGLFVLKDQMLGKQVVQEE